MIRTNLCGVNSVLIVTLLCLLMAQAGCSSALNHSENSNLEDSIKIDGQTLIINCIDAKEFHKAAEKQKLAYVTLPDLKNGGSIRLPIDGKQPMILQDSINKVGDGEQKLYNYIGFMNEIGTYIVEAQYYETGEILLINKYNGSVVKVWGIPRLSPDWKHIVVWSSSLDYDIMPNGIQMWQVKENNELEKLWQYEQSPWAPLEVIWVRNDMIYVKGDLNLGDHTRIQNQCISISW
jgi:hypothetical protein